MNQRDPHLPLASIADVQSQVDTRHLAIDRVGIRGIRYPVAVKTASGKAQHTVGTFSMTVKLREDVKGTHMSRFIELLEAERASMIALDTVEVGALLTRMVAKLNVEEGYIDIAFPYFIEKRAPVSQVASLLDVEVVLRGEVHHGATSVSTKVVAPVTIL